MAQKYPETVVVHSCGVRGFTDPEGLADPSRGKTALLSPIRCLAPPVPAETGRPPCPGCVEGDCCHYKTDLSRPHSVIEELCNAKNRGEKPDEHPFNQQIEETDGAQLTLAGDLVPAEVAT